MRRLLPLLLALTACGVSPQAARDEARRINGMETAALWQVQATTDDPLELSQVEAELGSRGEEINGDAFLGQRSLADARDGRWRRPRQYNPELDAIDCSDFLSGAAAQAELMGSGGPRNDRHRLDEDGDGLACDWKSDLERIAAQVRSDKQTSN